MSHLFHSTILLPSGFTGIDAEYEAPVKPDLVLKAGEWSEDECIKKVVDLLRSNVCLNYGYIFTIVFIQCLIHTRGRVEGRFPLTSLNHENLNTNTLSLLLQILANLLTNIIIAKLVHAKNIFRGHFIRHIRRGSEIH